LQYLSFLLLRRHNQELGSRVNNLELANNGGSIVGHEQLLQMIDNDLVATYEPSRGGSVNMEITLSCIGD